MMYISSSLLSLLGLSSLISASPEDIFRRANARKPVIEKREPHSSFTNTKLEKRASRFRTEKTEKFVVDGNGIPDVPFDIGESYAGLLPISDAEDETRELFFWCDRIDIPGPRSIC